MKAWPSNESSVLVSAKVRNSVRKSCLCFVCFVILQSVYVRGLCYKGGLVWDFIHWLNCVPCRVALLHISGGDFDGSLQFEVARSSEALLPVVWLQIHSPKSRARPRED